MVKEYLVGRLWYIVPCLLCLIRACFCFGQISLDIVSISGARSPAF